MTADLTTLLTVYHKQIKAGQYDTVEESINKVTEAYGPVAIILPEPKNAP